MKHRCKALYLFIATLITFVLTNTININVAIAYQGYSGVVVDIKSGEILYSHNGSKKVFPASLTKMMTLYVIFSYLQNNTLYWNTVFTMTENGANQVPSKMGLKIGESFTVKDAVLMLSIKSANDIAVAVAENISESVENFVKTMNLTAKHLGMYNTNFQNSSGLHDDLHYTTPLDMAILAISLKRDFQQYYSLFSKTSFSYKNKEILGHNKVVNDNEYVNGLKTGYTRMSGYTIATTAKKGDKELVGLVFGGRSPNERNKKVMSLLDQFLD